MLINTRRTNTQSTHTVVNSSTGVPLPAGPLPVLLAIHGGSYSHGASPDEYPNAQWFAEHGWLALSINYRLCNGGYSDMQDATVNVRDRGGLVCDKCVLVVLSFVLYAFELSAQYASPEAAR
jgi:acetyl esterase/lipase